MTTTSTTPMEESTLVFWELSRHLNGQSQKSITTERALKRANEATCRLGPHRKVWGRLLSLQHEIITGGSRKRVKKTPQPTPIRSLKPQP